MTRRISNKGKPPKKTNGQSDKNDTIVGKKLEVARGNDQSRSDCTTHPKKCRSTQKTAKVAGKCSMSRFLVGCPGTTGSDEESGQARVLHDVLVGHKPDRRSTPHKAHEHTTSAETRLRRASSGTKHEQAQQIHQQPCPKPIPEGLAIKLSNPSKPTDNAATMTRSGEARSGCSRRPRAYRAARYLSNESTLLMAR